MIVGQPISAREAMVLPEVYYEVFVSFSVGGFVSRFACNFSGDS